MSPVCEWLQLLAISLNASFQIAVTKLLTTSFNLLFRIDILFCANTFKYYYVSST
jgi:hypothetical protein